jgi:acetyl esterase
MQMKEIAHRLQVRAAYSALRMPLSWVNILAGAPITVDGRTLDGRTQWFLRLLSYGTHKPITRMSVLEARAECDDSMPLLGGRPYPIGEIVDRTFDGPGGKLRVRLYRPMGAATHPLPAILYFHGGGWIIGSLEAYDRVCRYFAARTGCVVVAVDYRLAPEHRFPAAIDDAVAAFRWLGNEAPALGIDPVRIVLGGDSAGGTIATVAAREVRGDGTPPCLQWLVYPMTDLAFDSPSVVSLGERFLITRASVEWMRAHYLKNPHEISDPRASPLRADDLAGLPPALVYTAGFDPLRDEGQAYADKMAAAGVKVIYREFESLIHGFVGMRGAIQAAARAMDDMAAGLRHELVPLGHG